MQADIRVIQPQSKKYLESSEARFFFSSWREHIPTLFQTSGPQNCHRIHFYSFKPVNLQQFFIAALQKEYSVGHQKEQARTHGHELRLQITNIIFSSSLLLRLFN